MATGADPHGEIGAGKDHRGETMALGTLTGKSVALAVAARTPRPPEMETLHSKIVRLATAMGRPGLGQLRPLLLHLLRDSHRFDDHASEGDPDDDSFGNHLG